MRVSSLFKLTCWYGQAFRRAWSLYGSRCKFEYLQLSRYSSSASSGIGHSSKTGSHLHTAPFKQPGPVADFITTHGLQVTGKTVAKIREFENEYYHLYLEQSEFWDYFLSGCPKDSRQHPDAILHSKGLANEHCENTNSASQVISEHVRHLLEVTRNQDMDSMIKSMRELSKYLTRELPVMNESTLLQCMRNIIKYPFRDCITGEPRVLRLEIASIFQKEFQKRHSEWDLKKYFLAADFHYHFRLSYSVSQFMKSFFNHMQINIHELSHGDLVVLMYHVSLYRKMSRYTLLLLVEIISARLSEFNAQTIGIICLGLFKSEWYCPNKQLLNKIIDLSGGIVNELDDVSLTALLKYLRRYTHRRMIFAVPDRYQTLIDLQPVLQARMQNTHHSTLINIVHLYEHLNDISADMIQELCTILLKEDLGSWRLKDLAKFCSMVGRLSFPVQERREAFEKIVSELSSTRRAIEIRTFMPSFVACLRGMSLDGFYPLGLIGQLFSSTEGCQYQIHIGQNLYHVSESVKIEVPHYTGPFLDDPGQIALGRCRKYESVQQKQTQKKAEREDITNELMCLYSDILGGREYVHLGTLLSHYNTPDIELRLDSEGGTQYL
ncbi:uncharacterized protein LOC124268976 [Haliotis rubra]|uniref:uncharacterized protein LOC124268976 n=1 Tax=Haliotis rubra TaxID=36100 RepID=UPI001EE5A590|nr:uncharacterized protein LOC124268976 [Haliotis rubra]XP_046559960.1 uncharacterized protein LOC124268976 [Haliotis rubra]